MISRTDRRRTLLVLIVLLGFGLRLHNLDSMSFWLDEGLTPLRSGYSVTRILDNRITIQEGLTKDTHPPLYYILIHFSRFLLGESDFAYRFPSAVAGVLLIPVVFQLSRRIDGSPVAVAAAGLAAINPLQIWYAQEARMYTLLVLLAAIATLALWRALSEGFAIRWLFVYIVFAGLAVYTHYTALFLLCAHCIFWFWLLWRRGHRRLLIGSAILGLLIIMPLVLVIYPRIFTGAETGYSYVSPLILLQDVVRGFSTAAVDFQLIGIKLVVLATGLLLVLGLFGPQRQGVSRSLRCTFLLTYLLSAVVGLMLGSLIKPMYTGVRHIMVGSPAFVLLVSGSLPLLNNIARRLWSRPHRAVVPVVGFGVLLVGPALSLNNVYHNPDYAKDDMRTLIREIDKRAGEGDLVLYNDAVRLPLQWHYQRRTDLAVTALPVYPRLAGGETTLQLEALSARYDRVWFVSGLPIDGRDNGGVVRQWLADSLTEVDVFSAYGRNAEVKVTGYSTAPVLADSLPTGATPLDQDAEGLPTLRGVLLGLEPPADLPTLWLDLFWQGGTTPTDSELRFGLLGPDSKLWVDQSYPFWPGMPIASHDSDLVRLSYHLPLPAGLPAGSYDIRLLSWDEESGRSTDEWQDLVTVEVAASDMWMYLPDVAMTFPGHGLSATSIQFNNEIVLLGLSLAETYVRPGHAMPLSLYWQAKSAPFGLRYSMEVVAPTGQVVFTQEGMPGAEWLTADNWSQVTMVLEQTGFRVPADATPGRYRFRWSMSSEEDSIPVRPEWRPWYSRTIYFGEIVVQPWPMSTTLPAISNPLQAQLGASIVLHGYDWEVNSPRRDHEATLTLYWEASEVPTHSYRVFAHLVSAANGSIVSQVDGIPVDWLRPTNGWRIGEILTDRYDLPIPENLTAGTYYVYVGMYDPDTLDRLPIVYQGNLTADSQLLLETLVRE